MRSLLLTRQVSRPVDWATGRRIWRWVVQPEAILI